MLPFLKPKQAQPSLLMETRKSDHPEQGEHPLHTVAKDMIAAIHSGDHRSLAMALEAAHSINSNQPDDDQSEQTESQE